MRHTMSLKRGSERKGPNRVHFEDIERIALLVSLLEPRNAV